jgi:hypothetical protein
MGRHYLLKDFIHSNEVPDRGRIMHDLWMRACQYAKKIGFDPKAVRVDFFSLEAALERYARDIFGCQRVVNFVKNNFSAQSSWVPDAQKDDFDSLKNNLLDELHKVGIRIPSQNPYIHKKCAFLMYHLILMRPFSIIPERDDDVLRKEKKIYFNVAVSAHIVNLALATVKYGFFHNLNLIRALTFRPLSRSAMEAMMVYACCPANYVN